MRASSRASTEIFVRRRAASNDNLVEMFGPYQLLERLDDVGPTRLHLAFADEHQVALKRLRTEFAVQPEHLNEFLAEAQLVSQLRHANVQHAIAYGKLEGRYFLALEPVLGPTLDQIMKQAATAAGAVPVSIAVELLGQLCDAVEYLHSRAPQIAHCDLVPANVLVSSAGSVKLANFARARVARELDLAADLYAIGVIAYELLTNSRLRVKHPPSRFNPAVSRDLDDIVLTALQRDPALRWQNAAALRFALRGVATTLAPVDGSHVRAWTEWAFTRGPRRETVVCRTLDELELLG